MGLFRYTTPRICSRIRQSDKNHPPHRPRLLWLCASRWRYPILHRVASAWLSAPPSCYHLQQQYFIYRLHAIGECEAQPALIERRWTEFIDSRTPLHVLWLFFDQYYHEYRLRTWKIRLGHLPMLPLLDRTQLRRIFFRAHLYDGSRRWNIHDRCHHYVHYGWSSI